MGCGLAGVVFIATYPLGLGPEIFLQSGHQAACERFEIVVFRTVLGRDEEAELVGVALRTLQEGLSVRAVLLGAVKLARLPLAGHAVPLDIAQMRPRPVHPFAGQLDDTGLDDDAALAESGIAVATGEHAADARATPDAAAGEAGLAC